MRGKCLITTKALADKRLTAYEKAARKGRFSVSLLKYIAEPA